MSNQARAASEFAVFPRRDDLAQAVQRLASVVKEENAALRSMDFGRAGSLLTSKFAAADALEASIRAVALDASSDEAAETLYAQAVASLSGLLSENETLHHRSARLQKRVQSVVTRLASRSPGSRAEVMQKAARSGVCR